MFYASKTIFGKTKDDEILQCSCDEIREGSFQNILKDLNSFLKLEIASLKPTGFLITFLLIPTK